MLIGWINVYRMEDILSIIGWTASGIAALFLLGYQASSYLLMKETIRSEKPKHIGNYSVRVLPESRRWEDFTKNQEVIREISEAAIRVATDAVVQWEVIYPEVKSQEARDVVRQCTKVYLYRADEMNQVGAFA